MFWSILECRQHGRQGSILSVQIGHWSAKLNSGQQMTEKDAWPIKCPECGRELTGYVFARD